MKRLRADRCLSLSEWQMADPQSHPVLRGLELTCAAREQTECWRRAGWLEILEARDGLRLQSFAFAGTVRIPTFDGQDLTVDIQPKIAPQTAVTFIRYALGIDPVDPKDVTAVPVQSHGLIDILAQILLGEVDELLHRGLIHDYRSREEWVDAPRGQIQWSAMARQPGTTRLALPCRYNVRSADLALNRAVLAALLKVAPQVATPRLRLELYARAKSLDALCSTVTFDASLIAQAEACLDRRSHHYESVLRLLKLLLQAAAPGLDAGDRYELPGFLFNMNSMFERFVARLCSDWPPSGVDVRIQASRAVSFRYSSNPYRWQRPRLRPDIVLQRQGEPWRVIDSKYKDIEGRRPEAEDLYQLTLYSMAFGQASFVPVILVYPTILHRPLGPVMEFTGFETGRALAQIQIVGLSLEECTLALRQGDTKSLRHLVAHLCS